MVGFGVAGTKTFFPDIPLNSGFYRVIQVDMGPPGTVVNAEWLNNTICIDTGCVFGGKLTALRYPENEIVPVQAHRMYYEPEKKEQQEEPEADGSDQEEAQEKVNGAEEK